MTIPVETLNMYVDGALSSDEAAEVDAALRKSAALRSLCGQLREVRRLVLPALALQAARDGAADAGAQASCPSENELLGALGASGISGELRAHLFSCPSCLRLLMSFARAQAADGGDSGEIPSRVLMLPAIRAVLEKLAVAPEYGLSLPEGESAASVEAETDMGLVRCEVCRQERGRVRIRLHAPSSLSSSRAEDAPVATHRWRVVLAKQDGAVKLADVCLSARQVQEWLVLPGQTYIISADDPALSLLLRLE